jgi:hypothetical protein
MQVYTVYHVQTRSGLQYDTIHIYIVICINSEYWHTCICMILHTGPCGKLPKHFFSSICSTGACTVISNFLVIYRIVLYLQYVSRPLAFHAQLQGTRNPWYAYTVYVLYVICTLRLAHFDTTLSGDLPQFPVVGTVHTCTVTLGSMARWGPVDHGNPGQPLCFCSGWPWHR